MRNFPVIRDLVVDISDFMDKLPRSSRGSSVKTRNPSRMASTCRRRHELDDYKKFSMCINCMLCYSACPVYALDPQFVGPAAIALAQRYNLDSRDEGATIGATYSPSADGVWACTFVGECSTACPKGVDPAGAIQRYKLTAATHSVKELLLPRRAR